MVYDVNQNQGIMSKEQFYSSPLGKTMSYDAYFMRALKTSSAWSFCTNPMKKEQSVKSKEVEEILAKLPNVKNAALASEIEGILQGRNPSKEFVELLLKRYEEKQAEFEEAWAKYQVAKGQRTTLKAELEKIQKRYANSESDYENGLVDKAEKNYKTADLDADIYLSIASYLAHRAI